MQMQLQPGFLVSRDLRDELCHWKMHGQGPVTMLSCWVIFQVVDGSVLHGYEATTPDS